MTPELNKIYVGDCLDIMRAWPAAFVHTVVTSPPYWGLRDYGVSGQMGLEPTPEAYVSKMVDVFREIRRVLRDDGTLWLNLGDSYASAWPCSRRNIIGQGAPTADQRRKRIPRGQGRYGGGNNGAPGLKEKDLIGIPWRVALALQKDGWYLRSDIIWAKPNPMPESVIDRPTKSHEYLFLLTKSKKYFYDAKAIMEPAIYREDIRPFGNAGGNLHGDEKRLYKPPYSSGKHGGEKTSRYKQIPDGQSRIRIVRDKQRGHGRRHAGFNDRWDQMEKSEQCSAMRNKRSVWTVATSPFAEAHFATFPPSLIKPCILAGSAGGGVVFDPFMGAGTTALVSSGYGRQFIGIELNPAYAAIAEKRIATERSQMKMAI